MSAIDWTINLHLLTFRVGLFAINSLKFYKLLWFEYALNWVGRQNFIILVYILKVGF